MLRMGEIIFSREEHTNWLTIQYQMVNLENIIQVTLYRLQVIFSNVHNMHVQYVCAATINEKRGHEFEREQGRLYGRAWRGKREGGNDVTVL